MPYHLVAHATSPETIECADELAEMSRAGEVIGIATIALMKRRRYFITICGECAHDPTLTRGMVAAMEDELRDMVRAAGFDETRT